MVARGVRQPTATDIVRGRDTLSLPANGRKDAPLIAKEWRFTDLESSFWFWLWDSPISQAWEDGDEMLVAQLCRAHAMCVLDPTWQWSSQVLNLSNQLGLSPKSRKQLNIRIEHMANEATTKQPGGRKRFAHLVTVANNR